MPKYEIDEDGYPEEWLLKKAISFKGKEIDEDGFSEEWIYKQECNFCEKKLNKNFINQDVLNLKNTINPIHYF